MAWIKIETGVTVSDAVKNLYDTNPKFKKYFDSVMDESFDPYGEPDGALRQIESIIDNDPSVCGKQWVAKKRAEWGLK